MEKPTFPGGLSRREFVSKGGLALAGMGLLWGWGAGGMAAGATPVAQRAGPDRATPEPSWQGLREELSGSLILPGDAAYAAAAAPWNQRYAQVLPSAIVRCQSNMDVQATVRWAEAHRVPLVVRGGGYSLGGYSSTSQLLLDVSAMNGVSFDPESSTLTVGAGARQRDLHPVLRPAQVAITHARCQGVGVAGMVLGGGLGLNMRRHGLTCDQLLETEVVTATGEHLVCNREQNVDLFWACRGGGGGNFAVHTSFTFRAFPVTDLTVFRLRWTTDIDDVLPTLLTVLPEAGDGLGCQLNVSVQGAGGAPTLELVGQLVGDAEELLQLLDPAYQIAVPESEQITSGPYWDGQDLLAEEVPPGFRSERSRYFYSSFPTEAGDLVLEHLRAWPGTSGSATWKVFLAGGKVDNVNRRATAYVHRGASMLSSVELDWKSTDSPERVAGNLRWQDGLHEALAPFTSGESYQNFADPSQEDYLRAYYAENLPYLVAVKRRLDPGSAFEFPQGVPLELEA